MVRASVLVRRSTSEPLRIRVADRVAGVFAWHTAWHHRDPVQSADLWPARPKNASRSSKPSVPKFLRLAAYGSIMGVLEREQRAEGRSK